MATTWQYTSLITGVVEALLSQDQGITIQEFIDQVGTGELLAQMDKEYLLEGIAETFPKPEDVYTEEDLHEWADANGYFQEPSDPEGYEERVRY